MKSRSGLFLSCAAGALLIGLGPITPSASAADLPVKAPVVAPEAPWWTHGFIELGGRDFVNNPPRNGFTWQNQPSLAKYYEYSTIKPGAFADFYVATGSGNGRYQIDAYGKNVGYSDQRYDASFSEAGKQYLNFQWDQTPHVYSTSAGSLLTMQGNALVVANPAVPGLMYNAGTPGWGGATPTQAKADAMRQVINNNVVRTDVGIRRDTAAVDYRYTPDDTWDIKASYSNMHRSGSQFDGVVMANNPTGARVDVAKPIDDTTHNFDVSGEYNGVSPWGQRLTAQVGYMGSVYSDGLTNYTVQNPFCFNPTGAAVTAANCGGTQGNVVSTPLTMMPTAPSNNMNGGTGTIGMDLPLNSRYVGTVTYSAMRQNEQFLPFTINAVNFPTFTGTTSNNLPGFYLVPPGTPANTLAALTRTSLNGEINTLMVNNVVTTQINPDLKTKLSYRYYDYDNQTPQITIPNWAFNDAAFPGSPTQSWSMQATNPLMLAYTRQNAGGEVNWRPANTINLGSSYGWERYDYTKFAADSTDEGTGKVYADWKPEKWLSFRASGSYGERRASNYDARDNYQIFQWGTNAAGNPSHSANALYRQLFLSDRNRGQAKFQVDVDVLRNLTVSPNVNYRDDQYQLTSGELGLNSDRSLAGGVDVAYAATPDLRFLFSYMNESRQQFLWGATNAASPSITNNDNSNPATALTPQQMFSADIKDRINTFVGGVNWVVVPSRFEVGVNYTASFAKNSSPIHYGNGSLSDATATTVASANSISNTGGQFPDVTTKFQRLEANAKYTIDPEVTKARGIPGEISLKLRYAWERNDVNNWQNDEMQPYIYLQSSAFAQNQNAFYQAMAGNNPNYNVHMLAGTVNWAW